MNARAPEGALTEQTGIMANAWRESLTYLTNMLKGDLGSFTQFHRTRLVREVLFSASGNSLGLMGVALGVAAIVSLPIGTIIALTRHSPIRLSLLGLTAIFISVPSFFAVVILQQVGLQFNVALGRRLVSMGGFAWNLEKMILPIAILAARPIAYTTRIVHASLTEIMESDYIRTANAKGMTRLRVLFRHAYRNLIVPYLSALGISFRFSLSTMILVEYLFAWPGVGFNLFSAIREGYTSLVVGFVLVIGMAVLAFNWILDIFSYLIDPRIRKRE
jgi:peptide/nickel transport system permease protein